MSQTITKEQAKALSEKSASLSKILRGFKINLRAPETHQAVLELHKQVASLLEEADRHGVINLDLLYQHGSWVSGNPQIYFRKNDIPHFITARPDGLIVRTQYPQIHFISAVNHVRNSLGAIFHRVGHPQIGPKKLYGQTKWTPARLEAI